MRNFCTEFRRKSTKTPKEEACMTPLDLEPRPTSARQYRNSFVIAFTDCHRRARNVCLHDWLDDLVIIDVCGLMYKTYT